MYDDALAYAKLNPLGWSEAYRLYRGWEAKSIEQLKEVKGPYPLSWIGPAVWDTDVFLRELPKIKSQLPERFIEDCARLAEAASRCRNWPAVFDDVYHLAFSMTYRGSWRTLGRAIDPAWLFRGQSDATWRLEAKVYRGLELTVDGGRAAFCNLLFKRANHAAVKAAAVVRQFSVSLDHAVAILQHYSGGAELDVATWLVDFTHDAWTALFFASDGGKSRTVGRVFRLSVREVRDRLQGCNNPFGQLTLTVPENVPRISAQHGVFVTAAHPSFFEQFVAHSYEFHQVDGVVFEDEWLGVVRSRIYPKEDRYLKELSAINWRDTGAPASALVPKSLYCDPYAPGTYLQLLEDCWLPQQAKIFGLDERKLVAVCSQLSALSVFHAELQPRRYDLHESSCSLNRLDEALRSLCQQAAQSGVVDLERALESYRRWTA